MVSIATLQPTHSLIFEVLYFYHAVILCLCYFVQVSGDAGASTSLVMKMTIIAKKIFSTSQQQHITVTDGSNVQYTLPSNGWLAYLFYSFNNNNNNNNKIEYL